MTRFPGITVRTHCPDEFLAGATQNAGSWWTHWNQWVTSLPGGDAKACIQSRLESARRCRNARRAATAADLAINQPPTTMPVSFRKGTEPA